MNAPFGGPLGSVPRGLYSIKKQSEGQSKKKKKASPRGQPEGTREGSRAVRLQQPELCDNRELARGLSWSLGWVVHRA